jgi:translation initiation factor eIF-2B subunit epsilon
LFPSFQNEYAARVQDFRSYHSICRDIVTRWVYPLVPDAQLLPGSTYTHTKRYTYREQGVKVSRSAVIGEAVVLSRGAVVGDNAQLRRTIVGRDCVIGANTKISNSHIWKGTYRVRTDGMVLPCIFRCSPSNWCTVVAVVACTHFRAAV